MQQEDLYIDWLRWREAGPTEGQRLSVEPTLAVCLDMWGQTVALRAGLRAAQKPGFSPQNPQIEVDVQGRLNVSTWDVSRNWRSAVRGHWDFPLARLSPWSAEILAASEGQHQGIGAAKKPGDIRDVVAGYLTACKLFEGTRHTRANRDVQSLLCWIFSAPHYAPQETIEKTWRTFTVGFWVAYQHGDVADRREAYDMQAAKEHRHFEELCRWVRLANRRVMSIIPEVERIVSALALPMEGQNVYTIPTAEEIEEGERELARLRAAMETI